MMIGSGQGNFARLAAWWFESSELIMVDHEVPPDPFDEVCPEIFVKVDVTSEEFVDQLTGKADIILCFMVTHELSDPSKGVINILRVLPKEDGSIAWFLDLAAHRWRNMATESLAELSEFFRNHALSDLENVRRFGLNDEPTVKLLYQQAAEQTGHSGWGYGMVGGYNRPSDIYEVTVGRFLNA